MEEQLRVLLALWHDGIITEERIVRWADQHIETDDPTTFPQWLIELSLHGPTACSANPLLRFPERRPLTFSDRFALRAVSLDMKNTSEVQVFVEWASRAAIGEDLALPEVSLGYQVDHCVSDCNRMDWAVEAVREELPGLLGALRERAAALLLPVT